MDFSSDHINSFFKGRFITGLETIKEKLKHIKAFVFDWDGVFNDGFKNDAGSSPYSEIDSMGTNMLRLSHYLQTGIHPVFAVISGEKNNAAFALAKRECFHAVYFRIKHKAGAIEHLAAQHGLKNEEIAFVFDDVLDFSATAITGLRIMVPHAANPLLAEFCIKNNLVDYITQCDGHEHAVRETAEMLIALKGNYEATMKNRMDFSAVYQEYLAKRNAVSTSFYTVDPDNNIKAAIL
jgi:3-deoxy-D-manno-octulosonate 8-phosphate phosphatase (KDO 8-P phosphatase)